MIFKGLSPCLARVESMPGQRKGEGEGERAGVAGRCRAESRGQDMFSSFNVLYFFLRVFSLAQWSF